MNWIRDNIVKIAIILVALIIVIVVVSLLSGRKSEDTGVTASRYGELENKVQVAAVRFVNDNTKYLPSNVDETTEISLETLIKNKYIGEVYAVDNKSVKCSGKVKIYKTDDTGNNYKFYPKIVCGKYYTTQTLAEHIIETEKTVTGEDGLYKEGDTYRYKGEYPNNYVKLDEQLYRIISIDSNNVLKLVKNTHTKSKYLWDDRYNSAVGKSVGITNYQKSRMKDSLEFLYSNEDTGEGEVFFTPNEKSYFINYDYCNGNLIDGNVEISKSIECSSTVNQKIGFINPSDYYLASLDTGCTTMDKNECINYNYLSSFGTFVLMNLTNKNNYQYLSVNGGMIGRTNANKGKKLYIAVHISSDNVYVSGTGTKKDPYIIR